MITDENIVTYDKLNNWIWVGVLCAWGAIKWIVSAQENKLDIHLKHFEVDIKDMKKSIGNIVQKMELITLETGKMKNEMQEIMDHNKKNEIANQTAMLDILFEIKKFLENGRK